MEVTAEVLLNGHPMDAVVDSAAMVIIVMIRGDFFLNQFFNR